MNRRACAGLAILSLAALTFRASDAVAQTPDPSASASASPVLGPPPAPAGQGILVLAVGSGASDDAFALARAVYGSRLRPRALDEVRARVLAGGPLPPNASRELHDLSEIRAGITTEDAAGRRLLTGLAQQVGAEAMLVVRVEPSSAAPATPAPAAPAPADAGADDAGNVAPASTVVSRVVARLFLASSGEFDAARYAPDEDPATAHTPAAWKSTVLSLEARFPVAPPAAAPAAAMAPEPAPVKKDEPKSRPFYATAWFWGAIGGAALLGTVFYFATRDSTSDTIHLQLRIPQ